MGGVSINVVALEQLDFRNVRRFEQNDEFCCYTGGISCRTWAQSVVLPLIIIVEDTIGRVRATLQTFEGLKIGCANLPFRS